MKFVNTVADLASQAQYEPDMDVRRNRVTLALTSRAAGGLTEKDFAFARQCDAVAVEPGTSFSTVSLRRAPVPGRSNIQPALGVKFSGNVLLASPLLRLRMLLRFAPAANTIPLLRPGTGARRR
jgi:hypothetical protein